MFVANARDLRFTPTGIFDPKAHRLTEDTIFHAARTEMRSQRKTVWTRSDNRNIGPWFHSDNNPFVYYLVRVAKPTETSPRCQSTT